MKGKLQELFSGSRDEYQIQICYVTYILLQAVNYRVEKLAQEHMVIHLSSSCIYVLYVWQKIYLNVDEMFSFFSVVPWASLITFYGTVNGRRVEVSVMLSWNTSP